MTELRQKLKDFEAELSAMVMEFHTANNIDPLAYSISPVFIENGRAFGERLKFITYDISYAYNNMLVLEVVYDPEDKLGGEPLDYFKPDFEETIDPIISAIKTAVGDFCFENDITYLQGEIGYVATHENKLLKVYTDLLVKP